MVVKHCTYTWLVCRALFELLVYDVTHSVSGFRRTLQRLAQTPMPGVSVSGDIEPAICDAVRLASCLYWKPVLCLQRSLCTARLLRTHGVAARLVIGYRAVPFFSHAWVEANGRVVNDSPTYRRRLRILYTI
jgi:hypothetical protein